MSYFFFKNVHFISSAFLNICVCFPFTIIYFIFYSCIYVLIYFPTCFLILLLFCIILFWDLPLLWLTFASAFLLAVHFYFLIGCFFSSLPFTYLSSFFYNRSTSFLCLMKKEWNILKGLTPLKIWWCFKIFYKV